MPPMPPTPRTPEQIFHDAREIADAAQRSAFLDDACKGDEALRSRVEALLAADAEAGSFLKTARNPDATVTIVRANQNANKAPAEHAGQQIGRYKLLQQIGEGGFGTVWMAEQKEPVKRRVALKIIKLGMDTKLIIARFEVERQALAMMDHPNIAKVFDAGSTDAGRPYFVMELVRGIPILEYCDTEKLDTKSRLKLFMLVCNAIQHAHQKGIIHRDIKPSNVMVTLHDGEPVPKVIDFGIAKATNQELTQQTLYTEFNQMVGTPAYMSPEQAEMSGLDIDTRSDIYSLGVLLYELLTGTTPFDHKELMHRGYAEMIRIIREETPHKPSTRLSTLGETATRTAEQRNIDIKKLGLVLRGDLDWIVMRCLEKNRTRRYDTATGLAADIDRHLNDEPVEASPPSTAYKVRKFVRRNRSGVLAASIVFIVLTAGIMGTSLGLSWALRERNNARTAVVAETAAKNEAQLSAARESKARRQAENHARETLFQAYLASLSAADASLMTNEPARVRAYLDACPEPLRNWEWDWLNARSDQSLLICRDRLLFCNSASWSHDGNRVYIDTGGGAVTWDAISGASINRIENDDKDSGWYYAFSMSSDGSRIAISRRDGVVRVWEMDSYRVVATIRGHTKFVNSTMFSPDGTRIVTASDDKTARVWDVATGECLAVLEGHTDDVRSAAFSPNGTRIVTASFDNTARVWDAVTGESLAVLKGHTGWVWSAAYSPDGTRIVTVSDDNTVRVWDSATGESLAELKVHNGSINFAEFSPDGRRIVTDSMYNTASVWDAVTGEPLAELKGHTHGVKSAAFSPDGTRIVTASWDNTARVWDAVTGKSLAELKGHTDTVNSAAFSPDGTRIVTASEDGTSRIWNAVLDDGVPGISGSHTEHRFAIYDPSWARIATLMDDDTGIVIWNSATGQAISKLQGYENIVTGADFNLDGTRIVTASRGGTARVWGAITGESLAVLKGHTAWVRSAAFSPDGTRIVTASFDNTARVWDAVAGESHVEIKGHTSYVNSAAFSPDGTRIVTASLDNTARVWDVSTGESLAELKGHTDWLESAEFSPDGLRIVTASADNTARVWDAHTGKPISMLRGHSSDVVFASFSPSGSRVVSASDDGTTRVWDTDSGLEIAILRGLGAGTSPVFFSADGRRIGTVSLGGYQQVWDSVPYRIRYMERMAMGADGAAASKTVESLYASLGDWTRVADAFRQNQAMTDEVRRRALGIITVRAEEQRRLEDRTAP